MYHVGDHGTVCPSTGTYNETYVTLCGLGVKVVLSKQLKRKITTFKPLFQVGQAKAWATLSSTLAAFLHLQGYEFLPLANKLSSSCCWM